MGATEIRLGSLKGKSILLLVTSSEKYIFLESPMRLHHQSCRVLIRWRTVMLVDWFHWSEAKGFQVGMACIPAASETSRFQGKIATSLRPARTAIVSPCLRKAEQNRKRRFPTGTNNEEDRWALNICIYTLNCKEKQHQPCSEAQAVSRRQQEIETILGTDNLLAKSHLLTFFFQSPINCWCFRKG